MKRSYYKIQMFRVRLTWCLYSSKIENLLQRIQEKKKGNSPSSPSGISSGYQPSFNVNHDEDLNKLDDQELNMRKAAMDIDFEKHRLKPGDKGFEYDKEVDFDDAGKIESGWDEEDDYSDPDF